MERTTIEDGLTDGAVHCRRLRETLFDMDLELATESARLEDLRVLASVSETPIAAERLVAAQRRLDALGGVRAAHAAALVELRASQDRLLGQLPPGTTRTHRQK